LLVALTVPAHAGSLAGVEMPDQVTVTDQTLQLNGMALRKKLIFKVYVAGLYLPGPEKNAEKILAADGLRRLVMEWVRNVDKDSTCGGWYEGLEANTPNASADVKKAFDDLCGWMSDVKSGDRFTFTYVPGEGTHVSVRGKTQGTVPGKAFADALFASWIGPKPGPGEEFKQDLLGN
jgi:hypothetical protein